MSRKFVPLFTLVGALMCSSLVFAQTAGEQRIVQPIIVNGQQTQGVMVVQNGTILGYTCPSPQAYTTANQSESGWACFDQASGMWLLHAQPPVQTTTAPTQTSPQTVVVYGQPSTVYGQAPTYSSYSTYTYPVAQPYYSYPYRYSYPYPYSYPFGYSYPFVAGPRFGVGFGAGFGTGLGLGFGFRSPVFVNRPFVGGRHFGVGAGRFGGGGRHFGGGGFGRMGHGGRGGRR